MKYIKWKKRVQKNVYYKLLCVKEGEIRNICITVFFNFYFEIVYILPVYFGKRIFRKYKPQINETASLQRVEVGETK